MRSLLSARSTSVLEEKQEVRLTVDGKIAQCSTGSPLYLRIMATEEEKDGIQGVATNGADFFFGYFSKSESSAPLKVYVVGEGKGRERSERVARKEVGCRAVCNAMVIEMGSTKRCITYSQGTGGGLQRLLSHSPGVMVRMIATCALALHDCSATFLMVRTVTYSMIHSSW